MCCCHRYARLATGDPQTIADGRTSYPSGHASETFACFGIATLYLMAKCKLMVQAGPVSAGASKGRSCHGVQHVKMVLTSSWPHWCCHSVPPRCAARVPGDPAVTARRQRSSIEMWANHASGSACVHDTQKTNHSWQIRCAVVSNCCHCAHHVTLAPTQGHLGKAMLCLTPLMLAALITCSRVVGYKHNFSDINAGMAIGLCSAFLAYNLNFPRCAYTPIRYICLS
jgi:hypothetical protein